MLVYVVREEDTTLINRDLNQLMRLDAIVYVTPLSGKLYQDDNTGL